MVYNYTLCISINGNNYSHRYIDMLWCKKCIELYGFQSKDCSNIIFSNPGGGA